MRLLLSLGLCLAACNLQAAEPVAYTDPSAAEYVAAVKAARAGAQSCVNNAAGSGYPVGTSNYAAVAADPLAWNPQVGEVARQRAAYLTAHNVSVSSGTPHAEPGRDFAAATRLQANAYLYAKVAENLGVGQPTAQAVVQAWLASTNGHCNALMDAEFTHMGLVRNGSYWVLVMARPLE